MSGPENDTPPAAPKKSTKPKAPASDAAPSGNGNGGGTASTAQATAAVSRTVSVVRERLVAGEQLVLTAALSIVAIVFFVFEFLLDYRVVSDFTVLIAILTVLAIWVHRWGHYDFGNGYRLIVGALGVSLALFAILGFLAWLRPIFGGSGGDALRFIGLVIYWVSGVVAGYGAWLVFRVREEE